MREHYHICDDCGGKGHFTKEDRERYYRREVLGVE